MTDGGGYPLGMTRPAPSSIPQGAFKLTIDEYRELPRDGKRYQLIEGEIDVTPAPRPRHQLIVGRVFAALHAFGQTGAGLAFVSPVDVVLDEHSVVQPDLLFVRPGNREIVHDDALHGAPDLVVEVLSPSTRRTDVLVKARLYARFGVPAYWIVDPDLDRLEAFRLEEGAYSLKASATSPDVFRPADFPGLELALKDVFGR